MQPLLNESRQLFCLKTHPDGGLSEVNPLVAEIINQPFSSCSLEKDLLCLSQEEKEMLDKVLTGCLQNPGQPGTIVLRNTRLVTYFKPVRWEITYLSGENLYQWIGFSLYNLDEEHEERRRLEMELIKQEWNKQKMLAQAAVDAQEKERADIGKELHDNISQMLTSTKLFLDILKTKTDDELVDRSIKNINSIIQEVRSLSRSLVPSSIADLGLIASMNDLFENIRAANVVEVEFYPDNETDHLLSANSKLTLYRIVQEQINNIIKHAQAKQIFVELFPEEGNVELIIADDGVGFDPETIKKGMGLKNMRSRAELLSGKLDVISTPGKGSKIKVLIPIN